MSSTLDSPSGIWRNSNAFTRTSSGTNYALQKLNPYPGVMPEAPSSHNYVGGFRSDFQLKDMLLAVQLAGESKTLATLGTIACNFFAMHCDNGYSKLDYSSIMMMMSKAVRDAEPKP